MEQISTPQGGRVNVLRNDPRYIQLENITNLTVQLFVNHRYRTLLFDGMIQRIEPHDSFVIYDTNEEDTARFNKNI
jgi:hypothetical protein